MTNYFEYMTVCLFLNQFINSPFYTIDECWAYLNYSSLQSARAVIPPQFFRIQISLFSCASNPPTKIFDNFSCIPWKTIMIILLVTLCLHLEFNGWKEREEKLNFMKEFKVEENINLSERVSYDEKGVIFIRIHN